MVREMKIGDRRAGGGGGGGGGWWRKSTHRNIWVEVCHHGIQTLTLFKTKIAHFTTLFESIELILRP